jgi:hypothetical protein
MFYTITVLIFIYWFGGAPLAENVLNASLALPAWVLDVPQNAMVPTTPKIPHTKVMIVNVLFLERRLSLGPSSLHCAQLFTYWMEIDDTAIVRMLITNSIIDVNVEFIPIFFNID